MENWPLLHDETLPSVQNQAMRQSSIWGQKKKHCYVVWTSVAGDQVDLWVEKGMVNGAAVQAWDAKEAVEKGMLRR